VVALFARHVKPLIGEIANARRESEAQQVTECEDMIGEAGGVGVVFLDPQIGLLNYWLQGAGIRIGNVLQDPLLAMPTVVLVAVWKSFGFYMVIFLAGLQDIPGNLYEAAELDGANAWKRFTNVTYPMLSNTLAFVVIIALIAAFQAFDQIYVLTGGGPYRSTETIVMQVYQSGFKDLDLGFASALSYVLLIITLLLSLVQYLFFGRRGEELSE